jgi:hypothetical protein
LDPSPARVQLSRITCALVSLRFLN